MQALPIALGITAAVVAAGLIGALAYRRLVLLERRARRAEHLAELGTLTGQLAHEIKNPLSTIVLNLQLLEEDLDPADAATARMRNRLRTVQSEAARLRDILDDFLRFAGKIEINRENVELGALLDELADFYTPQAQLAHVLVRVKRADQPLAAKVDPKLVKQAILNLMLNAVQAMSAHGGGELILSAHPGRGGQAVIDVIDTGPGVAPKDAQRIFETYYSTKPGGTGLGLAMARRIVEEHGGRLTLASEPGKGACFSLFLPR